VKVPTLLQGAVELHLALEFDHVFGAHADAVHAGVQSQEEGGLHVMGIGGFAVGQGEFGRVDRRRDVVAQKERSRRWPGAGRAEESGR
jgi:hypothetical protein